MKSVMKAFLLLALMSAAAATTALGGGVTIRIDEFGNITINGNPGPPGVIGVDPISGFQTLCYQLPFPGSPGDVVLIDPSNSQISDIIRFPGNGNMYFFSNLDEAPEPGVLADGPLPNPFNPIVFLEVGAEGSNGLFGYSPGSTGQGGDASVPTYDFVSDGQVPEPGSVMLLGIGLAMLGFSSVRRRYSSRRNNGA